MAKIEGFDEVDYKTLELSIGKKILEEDDYIISIEELTARIGIITGIQIPTGSSFNSKGDVIENPVYKLLVLEICNTIKNDKRYSSLTFDNYIQAFQMYADGLFSNENGKELTNENFKFLNLKYFKTIVNAYISHRSRVMLSYDNFLMTKEYDISLDKTDIDWRPVAETYYQQYLKGGYNPFLWSIKVYNTIVKDYRLSKELYKEFYKRAKQIIAGEINKDIMKIESKKSKDNFPVELGKSIQSLIDLNKISDGENNDILDVRAKQLCIESFFKSKAIDGYASIYVKID